MYKISDGLWIFLKNPLLDKKSIDRHMIRIERNCQKDIVMFWDNCCFYQKHVTVLLPRLEIILDVVFYCFLAFTSTLILVHVIVSIFSQVLLAVFVSLCYNTFCQLPFVVYFCLSSCGRYLPSMLSIWWGVLFNWVGVDIYFPKYTGQTLTTVFHCQGSLLVSLCQGFVLCPWVCSSFG